MNQFYINWGFVLLWIGKNLTSGTSLPCSALHTAYLLCDKSSIDRFTDSAIVPCIEIEKKIALCLDLGDYPQLD